MIIIGSTTIGIIVAVSSFSNLEIPDLWRKLHLLLDKRSHFYGAAQSTTGGQRALLVLIRQVDGAPAVAGPVVARRRGFRRLEVVGAAGITFDNAPGWSQQNFQTARVFPDLVRGCSNSSSNGDRDRDRDWVFFLLFVCSSIGLTDYDSPIDRPKKEPPDDAGVQPSSLCASQAAPVASRNAHESVWNHS